MTLPASKTKKHLDGMKMPESQQAGSPAEIETTDSSVTAKKKKKKKSTDGQEWPAAQDSVMTSGSN